MKSKFFQIVSYLIPFTAITLLSCERDEPLQQEANPQSTEMCGNSIAVHQENGIVSLNSTYDLEQLMETLAADETLTITAIPLTKSESQSLRLNRSVHGLTVR